MRKLATLVGVGMVLSIAQMTPAMATIDDIVRVDPGETYTWDGEQTPGTNVNYFGNNVPVTEYTPAGECDKDRNSYCQVFLFKIPNPITQEEQDAGITSKTAKVKVRVDWAETPVVYENVQVEPTDYDLLAFESSDLGERGAELGRSAEGDTLFEQTQFNVRTTVESPAAWVLVHVVYWSVPNANGYTGTAIVT